MKKQSCRQMWLIWVRNFLFQQWIHHANYEIRILRFFSWSCLLLASKDYYQQFPLKIIWFVYFICFGTFVPLQLHTVRHFKPYYFQNILKNWFFSQGNGLEGFTPLWTVFDCFEVLKWLLGQYVLLCNRYNALWLFR